MSQGNFNINLLICLGRIILANAAGGVSSPTQEKELRNSPRDFNPFSLKQISFWPNLKSEFFVQAKIYSCSTFSILKKMFPFRIKLFYNC